MTAIQPHHLTILEQALARDFIPKLPPLLDTKPPVEQQRKKNLSRSFGAFALHRICEIPHSEAAKAVVDDFDDFGVDAIYYHSSTDTLYLVQAKLKSAEQFSQEEALAFCQGIRKLIKQDFTGFNKNVQDRLNEIEDVLDNCSHIQLVVAHTGSGISHHAKVAVQELLDDEDHGEERFITPIIDYDATRVAADLQQVKAYQRVDTDIWLQKCASIEMPRMTYFGLARLEELVNLHQKYDEALYERNIRAFLGHKTDVNTSIRETLKDNPQEFLYLNNGVAALCQMIEPKGTKGSKEGRKLRIRGFSIINGAQTIASAASFLADTPDADISTARVSITLIKASADDKFGKAVTRARNHQNPVSLANFVALDDEQERLRRELAHLGIRYVYKAEAMDNKADPLRIQVSEAAQALALFLPDPRFVVWLKKEPAKLLDSSTEQYKMLFPPTLTPFQLVNAVRFLRYIQERMLTEARVATGQERLTYKHGIHALGWSFAKRIIKEQQGAKMLSSAKLKTVLSVSLDEIRQTLWTETQKVLYSKGPLSFFRSQTDVIPLLVSLLVQDYALTTDPIVDLKRKQQKAGQPYPQELFGYLISKAPQIGALS